MKNRKGFTLIELLAVIVVLAIIALIAVPIVLNIIENARKGAAVASARSYIKATETYIVSSELNKDKVELISNNKYNATTTTTIDSKTYQSINDLVEIKGSRPYGSEDYIRTDENNQIEESLLTINGYVILIRYDEVISITKGRIINVESISLDKTNETLEVGKTLQLKATITPNNATNKIVTWSSSDESIATVDNNGLVTGIKVGNATITATASNGKTATAIITVYKEELLSDKVNIGDYVAYDAGEWIETVALPTSDGNFGGYTVGQNKANSVSTCASGWGSTTLKGWRVLNISGTTVTIVHAGSPECYRTVFSNYDTNISILNTHASNEYLNSDYALDASMLNLTQARNMSSDLRATGILYHLASGHYSSTAGCNDLEYIFPAGNEGSTCSVGTFGVRPVVKLKPNIKTTGKTTDAVGQEAWSLVKP